MQEFILRDVLMIFGLGVLFVSLYLERSGTKGRIELGFSNRKNRLSVLLDICFAAGLLAIFLKEQIPGHFFTLPNLYAAVYILTAGIFEMTFIYGYLRMSFDMNAYDMLKMIGNMNMKFWFPIGETTLYETCIRLERKRYIENTEESDAKAIYRITSDGRAELKKTICALFERVDFDSVWFCLAVMYSGILTKEELARETGIRRGLLAEYENGTRKQLEAMKQQGVPYVGICAIERMIQIIEMEKDTLEKL